MKFYENFVLQDTTMLTKTVSMKFKEIRDMDGI